MKRARWAIVAVLFLALCHLVVAQKFQTSPEIEKKIDTLLSQMTLEEKVGQLVQYSGSTPAYTAMVKQGKIGSLLNITGAENANQLQRVAVEQSRLHIPLLFGLDVIHGYRTIFPIPLAEAASWDPVLVQKTARVAATEASAAGVRWTFAPMVDIARDPRWGRIAEGSGEDAYLGSAMAAARVRGFQGNDLADPRSIVACVKHFVAYGGAEGGRDYNTVDMSEQTLREIYLPPFQAAVNAGAGTVMSSFNDLNGIPASANPFTLDRVLRREWGFGGMVVSDWNSVGELMPHGVAGDDATATTLSLLAGVDMDMAGDIYNRALVRLVRRGKIPEQAVNDAVRRVLRLKFRLGLFDHPYADPARETRELLTAENIALARQAAQQAPVLLRNQNGLLPLSKGLKTIAVIGPLADNKQDMLGSWSAQGQAQDAVTVLAGVKTKLGPGTRVIYAKGADIAGTSTSGFAEALSAAQQADAVVMVLGEAADMTGEASSRAFLDLPGVQQQLLEQVVAAGKPVTLVVMSGRPLALSWAAEHVPAILQAWFLGVQSGNAVADLLFGDANPSGKLPVSVPRTVGQVPIYYNHKATGRPTSPDRWHTGYIDLPDTPLYPFGYGLSYTTFAISDLALNTPRIAPDGTVRVTATVANTGSRPGAEVVQLYIRDRVGPTSRPVRELKGFQRVLLNPGEKKKVEFTLSPNELGSYDREMKYVVPRGVYDVWVGPNSTEGQHATFDVIGQ